MGLSFPGLLPCLSQGGLSSTVRSSVQFSMKKLGQISPAGSYLPQAALRTHPGHHPGLPGRLLAPSLALLMCSQTTSLRIKQQAAQPRAPTSQKLPPSLQTMSLGGFVPSLLPTREAGVTPKQQSQAPSERERRQQHGRITADCYLNACFPPHKNGRDSEN